jgi:5'(3')-deoxyribonucleotidase
MSKYKDIVIACDMDDTIEYLVPAWIKWLNAKHGTTVRYLDIKNWNMQLAFPTLTWDQIFEPLKLEEFWDTVEPMKDAQYYIPKLIEEGFQFIIVTSSAPETIKFKAQRCLFKHFPYIEWKNVIIARKKQLIHCNILIDDAMHNIVGPYKGFLKATIHNLDFKPEDYPTVTKVYCWKHIYEEIHKLYD